MTSESYLAVGTMSGTSADGVDVALARTDGQDSFEFLAATERAYDAPTRQELLLLATEDRPYAELLAAQNDLTILHAEVINTLLRETGFAADQIDVIGFHGHTIRHLPDEKLSWQIGNASLLSSQLGIRVVHDFRSADLAAGGQGAPLAPLFHRMMLRNAGHSSTAQAVLNLGGVGNVTVVDESGQVFAGDTGPGCGLLDSWIHQHTGQAFDKDGEIAAKGKIDRDAVAIALRDPFFQLPLPRSADRHQFDADLRNLSLEDGAATLCAVTVAGVSNALHNLDVAPSSLFVGGGGSKHPVMMSLLADAFGDVQTVEAIGFRPDSLEAECFAWLAVRRLRGLFTSLPGTTGCQKPTVGGSVVDCMHGSYC